MMTEITTAQLEFALNWLRTATIKLQARTTTVAEFERDNRANNYVFSVLTNPTMTR